MTVDLKQIVKLQMAEIDRLREEVGRKDQELDELRQHLANLAPDAPDAHACLKRVYNDPKAKDDARVKAASAAIGYERSKPASVVVQVDFKERVRNARLRQYELEKAQWAAEDAAKMIEHQPTVLGGGPEDAA
jgi:hypothetical protein